MSDMTELMLCEVGDIVTGSTPSTSVAEYWNGQVPFYSPSDFDGAVFSTDTEKTVTDLGANTGRKLIVGSVMVTCIGSIGKMAICNKDGISNQQINTIIPKPNFDSLYLYYLVLNGINRFINLAPQTTIQIINKTEFGKFKFRFHEYETQQKIAKILSTVDNLIEKTQTLIEKYTAIKQGMMADLFTRGIDMTTGDTPNTTGSKLRPSVEDAPELYKQTELGWVPKEWEVLSFGELADYKNGNSFSADDWKEEGYPIIRIQNLNGSNEYNYYEGQVKEGWHILSGDLLFAWSGQKGVSFGARIWDGPEGVLNQHIFKVYENSKLLSRQFLYYLFKLNVGRIEDNAHGFKDSFVHVTRSELTDVKVMVPPKEEQAVIEQRVIALDRKLEQELGSLEKYKKIKKGLMQDLLTGKVKVA